MLQTRTVNRVTNLAGSWIPNCAQIGEDCQSWAPFYKNQQEYDNRNSLTLETEICEDILLNVNQNPDKLLYYNRMMTADPLVDKEKYQVTPDTSEYTTPVKYNFSQDLDDNVWIAYFG
jgi:hypothetical protein